MTKLRRAVASGVAPAHTPGNPARALCHLKTDAGPLFTCFFWIEWSTSSACVVWLLPSFVHLQCLSSEKHMTFLRILRHNVHHDRTTKRPRCR